MADELTRAITKFIKPVLKPEGFQRPRRREFILSNEGSDAEKAATFLDAFRMLKRRTDLILALPIDVLREKAASEELQAIGREANRR